MIDEEPPVVSRFVDTNEGKALSIEVEGKPEAYLQSPDYCSLGINWR